MKSKNYEKIYKITTPASLLFVGPEKVSDANADKLIQDKKILNEDVKIIRAEDSSGKSNIISVAQIREARHFLSITPMGSIKAVIFKQAELMPEVSANALLKLLEEPPKYGLIILTSLNGKLLDTIKSRCQQFNFWQERVEIDKIYNIEQLLGEPFYIKSAIIEEAVKAGNTKLLLYELEYQLRQKLLEDKTKKSAEDIKQIVSAKIDIERNVNARLVLETLLLKLGQNV